MDFFGAQAAARRRTAVLVAWFAAAWLGTIALAHVLLGLVLRAGLLGPYVLPFGAASLGGVAALVTLLTAAGTAWHGVRLARGGGHAVARMLGGVPVDRGTREPAERRLVNVVEEMAIASGLPVPTIYVLPTEDGINALAAGFTPDRAVVAVTRGALEALDRDELQGVVAHELSHVLNADARLNLRLVALVGGITVLALVGRSLVRAPRGGGRRRGRGVFPLVGACLWLAGSVGAFFGRVIRAAVSRQREFLADAAAVQFTRNPAGLAGALAKIALRGSAIQGAQGPEVSHLLFASGLRSSWLSTHPPIDERIRRIAPRGAAATPRGAPPAAPAPTALAGAAAAPVLPALLAGPAAAGALAASAGQPGPSHVAYAVALLARLPPEVDAAARSPAGARSLVAALLVDPDPAARELQLAGVAEGPLRAELASLAGQLAGASREDRLAVLELALPSLDALARDEAAALVRDLRALAAADGRTSVFEWAVERIVERRVAPLLDERRASAPRATTVDEVQVEALEVLSVLAWLGARDEAAAGAALEAGAAVLGVRGWRPLPRDRVRAARLDAALRRLDGAAPALKARLLEACAASALADGRVAAAQAEVVRAVAATLGVPVPPLAPATPARGAGVAFSGAAGRAAR
jgi:Zn-dependent protease with chaperone function